MRKKLGECLIQAGLITEADLQTALAEHTRTGERIGAVLVRLNLATEKQVTKAVAYQLGFPYVNLVENPPDRAAVVLIPKDVAFARGCIAITLQRNLLTVAMSDPLLTSLVQDLERHTGHRIKQVVATRSEILDAIHSGYPSATVAPQRIPDGALVDVPPRTSPLIMEIDSSPLNSDRTSEEEAHQSSNPRHPSHDAIAIDKLLDVVFSGIVQTNASDVHIEPTAERVVVRHRLDGLLNDALELPTLVHEPLIARLKDLAGMDSAETRRPQEGRLRIDAKGGEHHHYRAFTLNTLFGEKMVLRPIDRRQLPMPIEELGLSAAAMDDLRGLLRQRHGLLLVVGPAGSGRTATLSSAVHTIKSRRTNIATIESRIEYRIDDVNQTAINEEAGLSVGAALDAVLRQDPDIVLVGELPDRETAAASIRAAQRGTLVLSSLHAGDAVAAVTCLGDLSIDRSAIASALVGVVAQRLVRRLCISCRRQYTPDPDTLRALAIPEASAAEVVFYHAGGCDQCHHTGYRGRIALFEVMRVTGRVRYLIAHGAGEDLIREAAIADGMVSLGEDGVGKVKAGITSADEWLRVVTDVAHRRSLCSNCSAAVALDFKVCPHCGHRLGGCPKCLRPLQADWKYCPYCATSMAAHKKKKKFKDRKLAEPPASKIAEFKNQNR